MKLIHHEEQCSILDNYLFQQLENWVAKVQNGDWTIHSVKHAPERDNMRRCYWIVSYGPFKDSLYMLKRPHARDPLDYLLLERYTIHELTSKLEQLLGSITTREQELAKE